MFRCFRKFSAGTTQKVVLHLLSIFQKLFVDGTPFSSSKLCDRLKPLTQLYQPIKIENKINHDLLTLFFPALCTSYTYWLWNLIGSFDFLYQYGLVWVYTSANANCTVTNYWGHATTFFGKISVRRGNSKQFLLYSSKGYGFEVTVPLNHPTLERLFH